MTDTKSTLSAIMAWIPSSVRPLIVTQEIRVFTPPPSPSNHAPQPISHCCEARATSATVLQIRFLDLERSSHNLVLKKAERPTKDGFTAGATEDGTIWLVAGDPWDGNGSLWNTRPRKRTKFLDGIRSKIAAVKLNSLDEPVVTEARHFGYLVGFPRHEDLQGKDKFDGAEFRLENEVEDEAAERRAHFMRHEWMGEDRSSAIKYLTEKLKLQPNDAKAIYCRTELQDLALSWPLPPSRLYLLFKELDSITSLRPNDNPARLERVHHELTSASSDQPTFTIRGETHRLRFESNPLRIRPSAELDARARTLYVPLDVHIEGNSNFMAFDVGTLVQVVHESQHETGYRVIYALGSGGQTFYAHLEPGGIYCDECDIKHGSQCDIFSKIHLKLTSLEPHHTLYKISRPFDTVEVTLTPCAGRAAIDGRVLA